jgi:hypothetical protein
MNSKVTYRHVLARLATGPIYNDDTDADYWHALEAETTRVRAHFADMGLELLMDPGKASYAYLRQQPEADDGGLPLPRIMRRSPLSYHQTLMVVLLREVLLRHEQSSSTEVAPFLTEAQLREMMIPFLRDSNNRKKTDDQVRALIAKMEALKLLSEVKNRSELIYKVEQIVKAKVPADLITEIRDRLSGNGGSAPSPSAAEPVIE